MKCLIAILALVCAGPALAVHPEPASFVSAGDGARIAYYPLLQPGTVPVLVLSGGPGTDSSYMRARGALDELASTRSIVFYDQRGTSQSSDSNGGETIDKYVEDIEAVREAVGAAKVDLLGHSFGGYLAIAYTSRYPQHVRGLILVDSAAPKLGDVTQLMDQVFPERIGEWRAKRATLGKHVTAADVTLFQSMEFVDDTALREFLAAVKDHDSNMEVNNTLRKDMDGRDYWGAVRGFEQRALVVHGRFDVVIAPSDSWALHKALPNSAFHIIEAAGHLPHIERPQAFLAAVKPFLESLDHQASRFATTSGSVERMYVFNCGAIAIKDISHWSPGINSGQQFEFSNHCYLIQHVDGWMLWDSGYSDAVAARPEGVVAPSGLNVGRMPRTLASQLAEIGLTPSQVTHLAFSHMHNDHVGNAHLFDEATLYIQEPEYDAAFGPGAAKFSFNVTAYETLRDNPVTKLRGDHDVFGDGSVRIISTPGHTPGHQSLFVRLPRRGPVILSGDLVHFQDNWKHRRVPAFNYDREQSVASMRKVAELLASQEAELWINHDRAQSARIPKSPQYIE